MSIVSLNLLLLVINGYYLRSPDYPYFEDSHTNQMRGPSAQKQISAETHTVTPPNDRVCCVQI